MNAPFIYYFDSYAYMRKAIDFFSQETIQFGAGIPFVAALGILFSVFGNILGAASVSRLLMLLTTALLVYVMYSFGLKMSGKIFGFLAALFAIFEPYFLSFSIVPHNDVFAIATGLAALYFATSDKKSRLILSLMFFYFAVLTRPEFYLTLVIPIFAFYLYKGLKIRTIRAAIPLIFGIIVYVLPSIWLYIVARAATRFDIIEKFSLFLTPELVTKTLDLSFRFYDQWFLNRVVFVFVGLGMLVGLLNIIAQFVSFEKVGKTFSIRYRKDKSIKDVFLSDRVMVTFCLLLVFVTYIVVLTAYGYGYVIVDGKLIIIQSIPERYLILPRLLLSYPFACVLSIVIRKVYAEIVHKKEI